MKRKFFFIWNDIAFFPASNFFPGIYNTYDDEMNKKKISNNWKDIYFVFFRLNFRFFSCDFNFKKIYQTWNKNFSVSIFILVVKKSFLFIKNFLKPSQFVFHLIKPSKTGVLELLSSLQEENKSLVKGERILVVWVEHQKQRNKINLMSRADIWYQIIKFQRI